MSGKGQAPIKLKTGSSLETEGTAANVATNTAAMEALRSATVDGKDIRPRTTTTEHLSASDAIIHGAFKSGSLMVGGGGVVISSDEDGAEPNTGLLMSDSVFSLIKNGVTQVLFDGETGNASFKGAVYAESGSFPGSLVTGNISVASGGVTISNDGGSSGIYIGANQIYAKAGGVTTVLIDGATGQISASKFNLTADDNSQITLSKGTHIFSTGIQVGTQTLGGMQSATATAQTTANSAQSTANAAQTTATQAWNEATSRIKPGGGVAVDGNQYITTIDMASGIVVRSGSGTARTQMTSNGIAIYNSSGTVVVQADHSNGLWVNNDTSGSPGVTERVSLAYDGYEVGSIAGGNSTTVQFQQRGNGDTLSINFDLVELCPSISSAVVRVGSDSELYAKHRTYNGSYKGDTTFSFYAASSSGGSPTVKHTVTFKDGLITSWATS